MTVAFLGPPEKNDFLQVEWVSVGPRFFETVGIPILSGRDVDEADVGSQERGLWINRTLADQLPPGEARVGAPFRFAMCRSARSRAWWATRATATSVIPSARPSTCRRRRTRGRSCCAPPSRLERCRMRPAGRSTKPPRPACVHYVRDEAAFLAAATRTERLLAGVADDDSARWCWRSRPSGSTACSAYSVARRTSELAVRMALGAARGDVLRLVLREGLGIVGAGAAVGLLAAARVRALREGVPLPDRSARPDRVRLGHPGAARGRGARRLPSCRARHARRSPGGAAVGVGRGERGRHALESAGARSSSRSIRRRPRKTPSWTSRSPTRRA